MIARLAYLGIKERTDKDGHKYSQKEITKLSFQNNDHVSSKSQRKQRRPIVFSSGKKLTDII